jgi:hypothetical protein
LQELYLADGQSYRGGMTQEQLAHDLLLDNDLCSDAEIVEVYGVQHERKHFMQKLLSKTFTLEWTTVWFSGVVFEMIRDKDSRACIDGLVQVFTFGIHRTDFYFHQTLGVVSFLI